MVMSFESESKAFQAFLKIKTLHTTGKIKGEQMAVVQHIPNHIGVLLGWFTGSIVGSMGAILIADEEKMV